MRELRSQEGGDELHTSASKAIGWGKESKMKCQKCGKEGATRNRQNTAYVNDESNFATLCPECQEEATEYWNSQWNDYYRMVMG
jgi:hypothetical protein